MDNDCVLLIFIPVKGNQTESKSCVAMLYFLHHAKTQPVTHPTETIILHLCSYCCTVFFYVERDVAFMFTIFFINRRSFFIQCLCFNNVNKHKQQSSDLKVSCLSYKKYTV